jgi:ribosomal protein S27AE
VKVPSCRISDSLLAGDHTVPANAVVLEQKVCEGCGFDFLRLTGSQDKRCRRCHASPFLAEPTKPFLIH